MTIIAIANQKGGCGKTTTAINLAACLGRKDCRVLLIDMDPQGHASLGLGQHCEDMAGLYEVFVQDVTLNEVILKEVTIGVDLVPATISLAAVEHLLADIPARERQLGLHLDQLQNDYDFVIIDCPPTLGMLSFNALRTAELALVPMEISRFSLDGILRLQDTIELLASRYDLEIPILILPTLVDYRTRFTRNILAEIKTRYRDELLPVYIHHTVRLKEAAWHGKPVIDHAPRSLVAADFHALAEIIVQRTRPAQILKDLSILEERLTQDHQVQVIREEAESTSGRMADIVSASGEEDRQGQARRITLSFGDIASTDVKIAGDFNGWIPDKQVETRLHHGIITKSLRLNPGSYQYRLVIDGQWQEDPTNPNQAANIYGEINSILKVEAQEELSTV